VAGGQALPRLASLSASRYRARGGAGVFSVVQWRASFKNFTKSAGSRQRALLRWVQIALKPASETLGLHGVFKRGKGCKYLIADSAFKCMQVDARA
jgi:hypothetical protein